MKQRPNKFQGAKVVRGLGMKSAELDDFIEQRALDQFDARRDMWVVVADDALADLDSSVEIKGFSRGDVAIRYAQALSHGNVDHRVLRVTEQVLVVATDNEAP